MRTYRTLIITLASLIFCSTVFATERFVISGKVGTNLILMIVELDGPQIQVKQSTVVETGSPIINTAVLPRQISPGVFVFDVYFSTCLEPSDFDCVNTTLSLVRFDFDLKAIDRKDFTIPAVYSLSVEKFQGIKGLSRRLFIGNHSELTERKLRNDGIPEWLRPYLFCRSWHPAQSGALWP